MTDIPDATCFINAEIGGAVSTLRIVGDRIAAVGAHPARHDRVINLEGDRLLPGLINAHDHLQFNNFPRIRYRERYANVREWIADVTARRGSDPVLDAGGEIAFETRLLVGGVKNLLSGVTTVAHHDPFHASLGAADFPVRVLRAYGWAHSLSVTPELEVQTTYRHTLASWPWIIHAGEGVDDDARAEFARLEALGCIGANTLLVHGVAFRGEQFTRLVRAGAGVIWCPSSNVFLFGETIDTNALLTAGRLGLGSDSRLSGARDLLDELRVARETRPAAAPRLEALVTSHNARLLRLADRGSLVRGLLADLLVLPAGKRLVDAHRADLRLVMIGGVMRYGDTRYASGLSTPADCVAVEVDGREKVLDRRIAERMARSGWREPGLNMDGAAWRAA
jgi:cytosine/adenosine deaminase-related metal-dependent hydrolase